MATVKFSCLAISSPRSHVNERCRDVGSLRICQLKAATHAVEKTVAENDGPKRSKYQRYRLSEGVVFHISADTLKLTIAPPNAKAEAKVRQQSSEVMANKPRIRVEEVLTRRITINDKWVYVAREPLNKQQFLIGLEVTGGDLRVRPLLFPYGIVHRMPVSRLNISSRLYPEIRVLE